ncbi:unnamed protein product [Rhizophagus irregularis]|uniref:Uncharacterized protein n=1 Tax=Rhizophagus irregularis TaxID=588596 RepID=A0A2I1GJG8_9GLOM|nr:hypothetical protein RhiirA4_461727 [Rhizophagus irregularis]CAB4428421.1 unnamed protein product [Rhizophagus irregularis]CAB4428533.1 unnamed protein product [Rhizophagus irregularis]
MSTSRNTNRQRSYNRRTSRNTNRLRSHNRRTRGAPRLINMTNNANNINRNINRILRIRLLNNADTINRIVQINTPQIMNNTLWSNFFNGTTFDSSNNFESLILPSGCFLTSSFII